MSTENIEKEDFVEENLEQEVVSKNEVTDDLNNTSDELAKEKDKFLRLFAEFENYKKRTLKERVDLIKTSNQEVLQAMLPVLDDFDRAILEISKSQDQAIFKGVELIYDKFKNTLLSKGLAEIDVKAGDDFSVDVAEAITQIPAPSEDLKGKIVDVIEKGYKLGDKVIRYSKVVIGN